MKTALSVKTTLPVTYYFRICCRAEISRLQRIVELKTKEMNRVKRLAKTILDQVRRGRPLFKNRKECFLGI